MSRVFKCDRCGAFYGQKPAEGPRILPSTKAVISRVPADLCEDCVQSLQRWFEGADDKAEEEESRNDNG